MGRSVFFGTEKGIWAPCLPNFPPGNLIFDLYSGSIKLSMNHLECHLKKRLNHQPRTTGVEKNKEPKSKVNSPIPSTFLHLRLFPKLFTFLLISKSSPSI